MACPWSTFAFSATSGTSTEDVKTGNDSVVSASSTAFLDSTDTKGLATVSLRAFDASANPPAPSRANPLDPCDCATRSFRFPLDEEMPALCMLGGDRSTGARAAGNVSSHPDSQFLRLGLRPRPRLCFFLIYGFTRYMVVSSSRFEIEYYLITRAGCYG